MATTIRSFSGDYFVVPAGQEKEIEEYEAACEDGDETTMLRFEEGSTGWMYMECI